MRTMYKHCPRCATENVAPASRCECGYVFAASTTVGAIAAASMHEPPVDHDYLAARVAQAQALLDAARREAQADPDNIYKAAQALTAQQALNAVRAQWRAQGVLKAPPRRPSAVARPPAPAIADPTAPSIASTMDAQASAPTITPPPPATAVGSASKVPLPALTPGNQIQFRAKQAARAEAVVRRALAKQQPAAVQPTATNAAAAAKECPNCTATLPANASQCGCGYRLGNASLEMPALPLDDGARAMLTATDRLALDRGQ